MLKGMGQRGADRWRVRAAVATSVGLDVRSRAHRRPSTWDVSCADEGDGGGESLSSVIIVCHYRLSFSSQPAPAAAASREQPAPAATSQHKQQHPAAIVAEFMCNVATCLLGGCASAWSRIATGLSAAAMLMKHSCGAQSAKRRHPIFWMHGTSIR